MNCKDLNIELCYNCRNISMKIPCKVDNFRCGLGVISDDKKDVLSIEEYILTYSKYYVWLETAIRLYHPKYLKLFNKIILLK